uniref:DUF3782 domain-containing protein n=1 Tax=Candidatus Kentrum sp. LFY TaxID=2126342 RepID=A0A450UCK7_9GAMM|nr:MAG: hypothetical protein BECKLFY1418B_GA0070995_101215 [Candidatus Kentron sp. LFY]VFJ90114.1 MAG: hypothetical protein BECKLFY1418A_GA0070994_101016 [Candidatus Kentron sp. LFY]
MEFASYETRSNREGDRQTEQQISMSKNPVFVDRLDLPSVMERPKMSMSTQEPTPESVWAYLQKLARQSEEISRSVAETTKQMQETDRKMQETDLKMQETSRLVKETTEQMRETDHKMQETDRFIKETAEQMRETDRRLKKAEELFTTQWGRLIESLVSGSLIGIFNRKGIPVDDISTRVRGSRQGHSYEFDIIAHNGREIIIVEVKTTLRPDDVREFMGKLDNAKTWMPRYQDSVIYGAMAWLQTNAGAERMAENRGLFSIRAVGDSASLTNDADFKPRAF